MAQHERSIKNIPQFSPEKYSQNAGIIIVFIVWVCGGGEGGGDKELYVQEVNWVMKAKPMGDIWNGLSSRVAFSTREKLYGLYLPLSLCF